MKICNVEHLIFITHTTPNMFVISYITSLTIKMIITTYHRQSVFKQRSFLMSQRWGFLSPSPSLGENLSSFLFCFYLFLLSDCFCFSFHKAAFLLEQRLPTRPLFTWFTLLKALSPNTIPV